VSHDEGLLGLLWEGRLSPSGFVVEVPALTNASSASSPVNVSEVVALDSHVVVLRGQAQAGVVTDVVGSASAPLRPESVNSSAMCVVLSGDRLLVVVESVLEGTEGEVWIGHRSDGLGSEVPHPLAAGSVGVEEFHVQVHVSDSAVRSHASDQANHQWGVSSLGI